METEVKIGVGLLAGAAAEVNSVRAGISEKQNVCDMVKLFSLPIHNNPLKSPL